MIPYCKVHQGKRRFLKETSLFSLNLINGDGGEGSIESTRVIPLTWNYGYIRYISFYHRSLIEQRFKYLLWSTEAHSKPSETSKIEHFMKIVYRWKPLTIFAKSLAVILSSYHLRICYRFLKTPLQWTLFTSNTWEICGIRYSRYWLHMIIACQVKWCDTPLAPSIPGIATRSLHFSSQSPTTPLSHQHLIFQAHFKPILLQNHIPSDIHHVLAILA